jgi:endonuclease/exonuclease/phosphatase family metal-dependent hydrolase
MELVTWNVLHRVHAVNWAEPVIAAHAEEEKRILGIALRLRTSLPDVICLQEVSGDQLEVLRMAVPGRVFALKYPRVPRYYRAAPQPMPRDRTEYLVTIVGEHLAAVERAAEAFDSDRGKGFLIVEVDGLFVVNTHVTYGDKAAAQLRRVVEVIGARPCVVVGDFNADRAAVGAYFGAGFAVTELAGDRPTRPRHEPGEKSEMIDHVVVRGCEVASARVEDGEGYSDHNPVRASVRDR